ncbi:hypothetical protein ACU686_22615 [Yinghuangia aomiensis]
MIMNAREAMRRRTGRALAEAGNPAAPESAEDFRRTDAMAFEQVEEFDHARTLRPRWAMPWRRPSTTGASNSAGRKPNSPGAPA